MMINDGFKRSFFISTGEIVIKLNIWVHLANLKYTASKVEK